MAVVIVLQKILDDLEPFKTWTIIKDLVAGISWLLVKPSKLNAYALMEYFFLITLCEDSSW